MNLSTLKSLQSRIREATGADQELDFAIRKTFKLGPLWCSRYITDPDDMAPRFTTDPDGLGACVGLMREVLPGWRRSTDGSISDRWSIMMQTPNKSEEYICEIEVHALETHATLLAICAALIVEEEAKEKADV